MNHPCHEGGKVLQTAVFETIDEATAFAEDWGERVPGARYEIEHRSRDHTAWEAVEAEAALEHEYPSG